MIKDEGSKRLPGEIDTDSEWGEQWQILQRQADQQRNCSDKKAPQESLASCEEYMKTP